MRIARFLGIILNYLELLAMEASGRYETACVATSFIGTPWNPYPLPELRRDSYDSLGIYKLL